MVFAATSQDVRTVRLLFGEDKKDIGPDDPS